MDYIPIAESVENMEKDKLKKKKCRAAVLAVVSVFVVILGLLGALFLSGGFGESDYASLPRGDVSTEWTVAAEGFYNDAMLATAPDTAQVYSIMAIEHGKVVFERWYYGHQPDSRFQVYSVSKTVLALAVGLAVEEGLFNVDDRVIDYFPERLPENVSDTLSAMTIRHLLTMTSGKTESERLLSVFSGGDPDFDWIREFFVSPQASMPGTQFYYNFFASYLVAAIIEKTSGTGVIEYIRPRLLEPMNITDMEWKKSPEGICVGGWGMLLCTEDMAKLGQLLLQKGEWNGHQLVPAAWIDTMTSSLVESRPVNAYTANMDAEMLNDPENDHSQGYGYYVWQSKYGTYRMEGMRGNLVLVNPENETVLVFASNSNMDQRYMDLIWKHFARLVLSD